VVNVGPLTYFQLRVTDGKTDNLSDYYRVGLRYDLRLIMYYIVFGIMAVIGLILFIVPGLYVIRRYFLGNYYLVDKNVSTREALAQSAKQSKPYSDAIWGIIGVQVVMIFITAFVENSFSYLGIVLGELIACSYIFLSVLRYREIEPQTAAQKS
jgi:hypothetical protein